MKKSAYLSSLVLFAVLLFSFSAANSWAGVKLYKMTGEITAIDVEYHTVVIEVPMVGKTFTIGGPLSPDAVLERGGQSADLTDFLVGDQVVVTWTQTDEGHLILSLTKK